MNKSSSMKWQWGVLISIIVVGCAHGHKGKSTAPTVVVEPAKVAKPASGPLYADVTVSAVNFEKTGEMTQDSAVTHVTVYSDRARVTRSGIADVTTEPQVFAFRSLPGWVDDGSVRVSATAGRILDVRVERNFLARTTDEGYRKAEDVHKLLQNQIAAIDDEIAVLDAQKVQIESIKAFSLEKITDDTTIGNVNVQTYGDVVTFISDTLRNTAAARREAILKRDAITPKLEASLRRLEDMKNLLRLEQTTVLVTLQSSQPAQSTLELTYMMPGATWEPMHELRVDTSNGREVEVISYAVVTQTSGEDWDKAELSFSTQSAIQSVKIPEIESLTLGGTRTVNRITTSRMSSFSRAQQAYEGQSKMWNTVHSRSFKEREQSNFEQVYQSNIEYLQVVQDKTVDIFESLENRGTTAHFKAVATNNVRGDGHPTRMRIGHSRFKSTQKIIAVPEQSLNAARTLEMINSTGQSLLPGRVSLYQDGAFIGMTDIDFVAQGETFALFFNVADGVKLSRALDRKQSSVVLKKTSRMKVAFIVTVENLRDHEMALTLVDRIPVSEIKQIKVSGVRISSNGTPDSKGILRWEIKLKPREKREFTIRYVVDYPAAVIVDTRRKRSMKSMEQERLPKAKKSAADYQIQEQLLDLEEML